MRQENLLAFYQENLIATIAGDPSFRLLQTSNVVIGGFADNLMMDIIPKLSEF
ncbi:MAG: hypothetical protein VX918_06880 [Chloroflexota bacterium]|jgi:hypothetical protein|nr:hypothetical protein [Chloroflexota bacterium]